MYAQFVNVLRGKLTYMHIRRKQTIQLMKVVFITKTNREGLDVNVHLCSLISGIESCTQKYECDSIMHKLRFAKPLQSNLPKNTVV